MQTNYLKYWHNLGLIAANFQHALSLHHHIKIKKPGMSGKSDHIYQYQLAQVIIETLNALKRKGYKLEFRREATCIYCFEWQQWIMPANFLVDESYYFEEIVNPDADRMLYAISLSQGGKGFLVDTCNSYMDNISPEMALRLNKITKREDDFINIRKRKDPVGLIDYAI